MVASAMPSGSDPFFSARFSLCRPCWIAISDSEFPASHTVLPSVSNTVHPRVPPFQSPSFAVAMCESSIHPIASGSRGPEMESFALISPSLVASTPLTVASPALNTDSISPVAASRIAIPLFSWRVTATLVPELNETYSGSKSSGVSRPAFSTIGSGLPSSSLNMTGVAAHELGSPSSFRV